MAWQRRIRASTAARRSTVHRQATGNRNNLAGDKSGIIRRQETNDPGIVTWLAKAFHRYGPFEAFGDLGTGIALGELGKKRCVGRTGCNCIQLDALASQFTRDSLGKCNYSPLAGCINGLSR